MESKILKLRSSNAEEYNPFVILETKSNTGRMVSSKKTLFFDKKFINVKYKIGNQTLTVSYD